MDILLSAFVKKHIEDFDLNNLNELENFLKFDDEIILNFYNHNKIERDIDKNPISKIFKNLRSNGGEGGIRTHERVAPLLVFKTSAFNRSATSPTSKQHYLLLSKQLNNNK